MTATPPTATDSRVIRVFLSSTFRDFMEERDQLVKQVFPELRRKARERGVELVEVDLRWGITEEESRQGKVLPICLAEINRCRPYFIGMLGERYGWVPPDDDDNRVVLADEPWVEEHLGRRSVTELEILHGVLRNPEMAGRAFFYFRDPAWSRAQTEPGFVCDSDEEAEMLADLKQRIRNSGFPLVEKDLPNPAALANRIRADLLALIEQQYPELDQPDFLEQEERKHASYRRARTEIYEDGGSAVGKVWQLEQWIASGKQQILITGDSGAGKSALIANWMQHHQLKHPEDVVFAHHLGCSNDANALEPLLARMVQTASKLMAEDLLEPIKVPQDYWELVSTVTATLGKLSDWCIRYERHWIWVLDGLDRLPEQNQQALPWLPPQLFPHLHVVISALDCSARKILQEREYATLTIGPLELEEQKALIKSYMQRYNKSLLPELETKILEHEPARSPLFLRVVLDELRLCGRHETLAQQLDDYLKAGSAGELYAKVLQRLEGDVDPEAVQKVMKALWASRAGLSETELLTITDLVPLQWAPIDLGLEGALGRNSGRLLFDHDYLRWAVEKRYLCTIDSQKEAHGVLADWCYEKEGWDERDAEEWPWQLQQAGWLEELRDLLLDPLLLANLVSDRGPREAFNYWKASRKSDDCELDELLAEFLENEIERMHDDAKDLAWFAECIAELLETAGLFRGQLLMLRKLLLDHAIQLPQSSCESRLYYMISHAATLAAIGDYQEAEKKYRDILSYLAKQNSASPLQKANAYAKWADLLRSQGNYEAASENYLLAKEFMDAIFDEGDPRSIDLMIEIGLLRKIEGEYEQAKVIFENALGICKLAIGAHHPMTVRLVGLLGDTERNLGDNENARLLLEEAKRDMDALLGPAHPDSLETCCNLANVYLELGRIEEAKELYEFDASTSESLLGAEHPSTLASLHNLAYFYCATGHLQESEAYYKKTVLAREHILGSHHLDTNETRWSLADLLASQERYAESIPLRREIVSAAESVLGRSHASTLEAINNLANELYANGDLYESEAVYASSIEDRISLLGDDHPATMLSRYGMARTLSTLGRHGEAIELRRIDLDWCKREKGDGHPSTLTAMRDLAADLFLDNRLEDAENLYRQALTQAIQSLGDNHHETTPLRDGLARTLSAQNRYEEAIRLRRIELAWYQQEKGAGHPDTLLSIEVLAWNLLQSKKAEEAESLFRQALNQAIQTLGEDHAQTMGLRNGLASSLSAQERYEEAIDLRGIELIWCRQEIGDRDRGTLASISALADDLKASGDPEAAEPLYRECLAGRIEILGDEHPDTMATRFALADCLSGLERYDEAIELRRIELAWCQREKGADDPDTLFSLHALGIDLVDAEQPEARLELLQDCLKRQQQLFGSTHVRTLVTFAWVLDALSGLGRHVEAIALSQSVQQKLEAERGKDDPEVLTQLSNQAQLYERLERLEDAERLWRRCLEGHERSLESVDALQLNCLEGLASVLCDLERPEEAEPLYRRALRAREDGLGPDHPDTQRIVFDLAEVLSELERYEEAMELRQRELAWCRKEIGDRDRGTLASISALADDLKASGDPEAAEPLYRECLAGRIEILGDEHPDTMASRYNLAGCLGDLGHYREAVESRRIELAWSRRTNGDHYVNTLASIERLAIDLREIGELEEAEVLFRELVAARLQVLQPEDFQIGTALGGLAMTLEAAGKPEEALDVSQQALHHRLAYESQDSWWTNCDRLNLARVLHKLGRMTEAFALLQELQASMKRIEYLDDDDCQLISDAGDLMRSIEEMS